MQSQYDLDSLKEMTDKELIWLITYGHKKTTEVEKYRITNMLRERGYDTSILEKKFSFTISNSNFILLAIVIVLCLLGNAMMQSQSSGSGLEGLGTQLIGFALYWIGIVIVGLLCLKFVIELLYELYLHYSKRKYK